MVVGPAKRGSSQATHNLCANGFIRSQVTYISPDATSRFDDDVSFPWSVMGRSFVLGLQPLTSGSSTTRSEGRGADGVNIYYINHP